MQKNSFKAMSSSEGSSSYPFHDPRHPLTCTCNWAWTGNSRWSPGARDADSPDLPSFRPYRADACDPNPEYDLENSALPGYDN